MSWEAGLTSGKAAKGKRGSDGAHEWRHRIGQKRSDGRDDEPMGFEERHNVASVAILKTWRSKTIHA